MDLQLEGKRALVTGSTAGIRFAIATALAAEGAQVIINGRTEARVRGALEKLAAGASGQGGAKPLGLAAELGTAEGCAKAIAAHPELDILVNNVGIFEPRPFAEISDGG